MYSQRLIKTFNRKTLGNQEKCEYLSNIINC